MITVLEVEIPQAILEKIAQNPAISLHDSGLLKFINDFLEEENKSYNTRMIWELFLKTKFLIFERI